MIVFNKERFFSGGRWGVIQNQSFRCALITDRISTAVMTFTGEWDWKNHRPVAEALLSETLTGKQLREIHDVFLDEIDQYGNKGLDLGAAIEQVFGRAHNSNIVVRYQNEAAMLLAAGDSQTQGSSDTKGTFST